ncbi:MAG: hypothetical protein H6720_12610 [Sandaracinus sp.]|nr:hypothetical protein [Sandaracinus sp.]
MRSGLILLGLAWLGCGGGDGPTPETPPEILEVRATAPSTQGTLLRVVATEVDRLGPSPRLAVDGIELPQVDEESAELRFALTASVVASLGDGIHDVELELVGDAGRSDPFPFRLEIARSLPVALDGAPSGDVHRNDLVVLEGDGFLEPREGELVAHVVGELVTTSGTVSVDARMPVELSELGNRTRGLWRLSTALGGNAPGELTGTLTLESELATGTSSTSEARALSLRFLPPAVFALDPATVSLEQIVRVRGAGFVGGDDGVTILRAEGTFTPMGDAPVPVPETELVLEYVDGSTLAGPIRAVPLGEVLVSELFGARRGVFEGTLTPVTSSGARDEVVGDATPITLTLGAVRQVVWLRFLPGFYESLARFGLAASVGVIEEKVRTRIESLYTGFRVEVRLDRPTDFGPSGFAVVEIGGPDPNGRGLFGYDNSPGKDVGNLRLFDAIGGANAETQADGSIGYGGVFVDSLFGFSEHPPAELGGTGPDPDPLFDEIFDVVRDEPATLAEVRGEGARARQVGRAVDALSSVIGETTAHELGHSLGLADPYGSRTVFHDPGDSPGCIMESGSARPFGERAAEPGFPTSRFCRDAPTYLEAILGN